MRKQLLTLLVFAAFCSPAQAAPPVGAWTQVLATEFSGTSLGAKWYPNRWFAATCAKGATSDELQYHTSRPSNVSVSGGRLNLTAQKESYTCSEGSWAGTSAYTTGWVQTGGSRASDGSSVPPGFTIGGRSFVEARIKLPPGNGLWSAVWMLQTYNDGKQQYPSRPEIDNLEVLSPSPSTWRFHVHLLGIDDGFDYAGPLTTTGFHTIGLWRTPDEIRWYVDGVRAWEYGSSAVPAESVQMYVILSLAVGGWAGPPTGTVFPASMVVDYVRAWKRQLGG